MNQRTLTLTTDLPGSSRPLAVLRLRLLLPLAQSWLSVLAADASQPGIESFTTTAAQHQAGAIPT